MVRFRLDARKSHFDPLVSQNDSAVFWSTSTLVVAVLIETVLGFVASVVASGAFVNIDASLSCLYIFVSAGADADKGSVKVATGDVGATDVGVDVAFVYVIASVDTVT